MSASALVSPTLERGELLYRLFKRTLIAIFIDIALLLLVVLVAQVRNVDGNPLLNVQYIELVGEIRDGDAESIENVLRDRARTVLYLSSSGGEFVEGIAIPRFLELLKIETVIRKNDECYSACAIAFLGGTVTGAEETPLISRTVEIGGQLGFHAPYLDVPRKI